MLGKVRKIASAAHAFNCPSVVLPVKYHPYSISFFGINTSGIEISSLKVAEEGNEHLDIFGKLQGAVKTNVWVLRVYETLGKIQTAMITVPKSWGIKDIACTDLLERKNKRKNYH